MKFISEKIFCWALVLLMVACESSKPESVVSKPIVSKPITKEEILDKGTADNEGYEDYLEPKEIEIDGYTFKVGYDEYDEEKFGFSNPGYLNIIKNEKVIFNDSFMGEGDVYIQSLKHHALSGDKLLFSLNWGTEACDYTQYAKYYTITPEGKVHYLNEYWSFSGGDGYASRYFEHIFPEDSLGKKNALLVVEGMKYHEHDQPDLSDTSRILFSGDKFQIIKKTNNLAKAK